MQIVSFFLWHHLGRYKLSQIHITNIVQPSSAVDIILDARVGGSSSS
jgi:hypothetical protein